MSVEKLAPGEDTRQVEMGKKEGVEVDGTKVGRDAIVSNSDQKDGKGKEALIPTVAEIGEQKAVSNKVLEEFAQKNPDALALKDRGPEIVAEAGANVQKEGWPC